VNRKTEGADSGSTGVSDNSRAVALLFRQRETGRGSGMGAGRREREKYPTWRGALVAFGGPAARS